MKKFLLIIILGILLLVASSWLTYEKRIVGGIQIDCLPIPDFTACFEGSFGFPLRFYPLEGILALFYKIAVNLFSWIIIVWLLTKFFKRFIRK